MFVMHEQSMKIGERERERGQTDRQTDRQTETEAERQKEETERDRDRQTDRGKDDIAAETCSRKRLHDILLFHQKTIYSTNIRFSLRQ